MNDKSQIQRLCEGAVDEGYLIATRKKGEGQRDMIVLEKIDDHQTFFVCLVNAMIVDPSVRNRVWNLSERLAESVELADEARAIPKMN